MRIILVYLIFTILPGIAMAQNHRRFTREGNREYSKQRYDQSEIEYRKAIDAKADADKAIFNLGDALYRMENYEEAGKEFDRHAVMKSGNESVAASHYNRGNSLLKAGKIEESIDAYKSSLLANPGNHEAKYNLAYAQDLLKQQQQQQQDQENQDKDKDKDKKDQQDKDQENQDKDKQDQENQDNQNQDQNQQQKDNNEQQQQDQSQPRMTREDAERLLQALANEEKEVQEKVKKEKAAAARVRVLKNW